MPKRSVAARSGAQRQKPRAQKSFELVRPEVEELDEAPLGTVPAIQSVATETATPKPQESRQARTAKRTTATAVATEPVVETKSESIAAPKVSASTRMATRRQATQRTQRSSATLISAEHFAYVRRDLLIIATLAVLMFAAIIVLYFAFGRGA